MEGADTGRGKLAEKGKKIYRKLQPKLEETYPGRVVAIEVESGDYVIGEDEQEAAQKAREKFPGRIFYFFKIGSPVLHKLR